MIEACIKGGGNGLLNTMSDRLFNHIFVFLYYFHYKLEFYHPKYITINLKCILDHFEQYASTKNIVNIVKNIVNVKSHYT